MMTNDERETRMATVRADSYFRLVQDQFKDGDQDGEKISLRQQTMVHDVYLDIGMSSWGRK
jgi:hypothetical protein